MHEIIVKLPTVQSGDRERVRAATRASGGYELPADEHPYKDHGRCVAPRGLKAAASDVVTFLWEGVGSQDATETGTRIDFSQVTEAQRQWANVEAIRSVLGRYGTADEIVGKEAAVARTKAYVAALSRLMARDSRVVITLPSPLSRLVRVVQSLVRRWRSQ